MLDYDKKYRQAYQKNLHDCLELDFNATELKKAQIIFIFPLEKLDKISKLKE